jgi:LPXTG-motif cell wall-anchored protein
LAHGLKKRRSYMKAKSPVGSRMLLAAAGGLVITMGVVATHARADVWDKKTILTVNQPIQVEDTYLEPGTYVFKLLNSSSERHIVQIYNRDQNHLINTIMAMPNYRVQETGGTRFTYYETPPGTAPAMRAWFYPGDNYGQEFRYPKNPRVLAVASTTQVTAPQPVRPPEPPPPAIATRPAEPEPAPQAEVKPEEPAVIAQNNPPPAQPEPAPAVTAPAPEPAPIAQPTELPKTGTSFPAIGLGGLLALAGFGLLRMRRSA